MADAPLRVLVVEDDPQALGFLCALIADWGYLCDPARSASVALDLMRTKCPDVVLSDLVMPGMDGIELLKTIRSICDCSLSSFVLITGHGSVSSAVRAIMEGADEVLVKPVNEVELRAVLKLAEARKSAMEKTRGDH